MSTKTNKTTGSANVNTDASQSLSNGKDSKKQGIDPRLKTILPLIATQLDPIQEVITYYAKAFLDRTRALKSRQTTLAKFKKIIPYTTETANELPTPNSSFYIPKSARVKITLTYSNALKNETEIKDLEQELKESIKDFGTKVAYIFERTAKLEEKQEKTSRLHTFLNYCHKLTQGFTIIAKRRFDFDTNLNTERLELWCLLALLRTLKKRNVAGLPVYEHFLETEYNEVKAEFIKLFLPNDPTIDDEEDENNILTRRGSNEEQRFILAVSEQVEGLITQTTFDLQVELDRQEEKQTITSMITAKFKRNEILTATEATALAIHDTHPSNQNNLDQHIKNLIDEAINRKLASTQLTTSPSSPTPHSKKRKNSQGSEKPQSLLPKIKRGNNNNKKKVSFRYQLQDNNDEEKNEHQETQTSKKQKHTKTKNHQQKYTPKIKSKSKQNQNQKENQEDKKREAEKGKN